MAEKFDHLEEHLEKFVENIRQLGIIVSDFQPSSQAGLEPEAVSGRRGGACLGRGGSQVRPRASACPHSCSEDCPSWSRLCAGALGAPSFRLALAGTFPSRPHLEKSSGQITVYRFWRNRVTVGAGGLRGPRNAHEGAFSVRSLVPALVLGPWDGSKAESNAVDKGSPLYGGFKHSRVCNPTFVQCCGTSPVFQEGSQAELKLNQAWWLSSLRL